MKKWLDIAYLEQGTPLQREVSQLLRELRIMELLADYHPLLAGTVPLGIQVEGSDLDILCEVHDPGHFTAEVCRYFGEQEGFCTLTRTVRGIPRTTINFNAGGWPIELYGQPLETAQQNGFRHMLVEGQILNLLGKDFREEIRLLKSSGMKTEPAFARLLKLEGDPYEALLSLGRMALDELDVVCKKAYLT